MATIITMGIIRKTRKPIIWLLYGDRKRDRSRPKGGKNLENALGRLWIQGFEGFFSSNTIDVEITPSVGVSSDLLSEDS